MPCYDRTVHVLIVNQYALPAGAPGITRHGDLGAELARRGHSVTVLASSLSYLTRTHRGRKRGPQGIAGVTFHWLTTGSYTQNDSRRTRSMVQFGMRAILTGVALGRRPDVVIGSSPQLLAALSAWVIARRYGCPFLFEVRDPWPSALVDLGAIRAGGLTHRLLEWVERFLYRQADRIITVMEHADRRVEEVGEDSAKAVHIPNASTVPEQEERLPESLDTLLEHEVAENRTIVIYAGAHGVSNGLSDVLDALEALRNADRDAYERVALVFIGAGPAKPSLQAKAASDHHVHVHFHDAVGKPVLFSALRRADFVLVHFAQADFKRYGMSANKLFDAMAVAKPVLLATPLADTPVDTVECGIRYEPGNVQSLAETLAQAIRMPPDQRLEMGQRGQAEMCSRYSLDVTGRQLDELIRDVAAQSEART